MTEITYRSRDGQPPLRLQLTTLESDLGNEPPVHVAAFAGSPLYALAGYGTDRASAITDLFRAARATGNDIWDPISFPARYLGLPGTETQS